MGQVRDAILENRYPQYIKGFFKTYFGDTGYPKWAVEALRSVGVDLLEGVEEGTIPVVEGDGAKWEYSASA
jgi:queuine tRNA-ribosyltransferase